MRYTRKRYDTKNFEGVTALQLRALLESNFSDEEDAQNDSPTYREFLEFMEAHPGVTAHGYIVTPDREDCRVSIEGIEYEGAYTMEWLKDFAFLCRHADEFKIDENGFYCWYD